MYFRYLSCFVNTTLKSILIKNHQTVFYLATLVGFALSIKCKFGDKLKLSGPQSAAKVTLKVSWPGLSHSFSPSKAASKV